jgi:hypothetical protein
MGRTGAMMVEKQAGESVLLRCVVPKGFWCSGLFLQLASAAAWFEPGRCQKIILCTTANSI